MSLLFHQEDGQLSVAADCSDCFCWGCADAEEITPENVELYRQTLEECEQLKCVKGYASVFSDELFAARVRKMRPQGASYHLYPPEMWPLFDACGPERITGMGNPKEQPKRPEDAKGWNQPRRVTEKEWQGRAEAAEQALREARDINHDLASTRFAKWKQLRAENEKLRELLREITHALKLSFAGKNVRCADELISRAEALSPSPTPAPDNNTQSLCHAKPSTDSATPAKRICGNCGLPLEANETEEMCRELSDRAATMGKGEQG
jgi:hypothetical protein